MSSAELLNILMTSSDPKGKGRDGFDGPVAVDCSFDAGTGTGTVGRDGAWTRPDRRLRRRHLPRRRRCIPVSRVGAADRCFLREATNIALLRTRTKDGVHVFH